MKITMQSVPASEIRNDQLGDWKYDNSEIVATVRDDLPDDSQVAILFHEVKEAYLCRKHRITDDQVCGFDAMFELERSKGYHSIAEENGDDPRAPYREEHQAATFVERAVCLALGLTWEQHGINCSIWPQPEPDSATHRP